MTPSTLAPVAVLLAAAAGVAVLQPRLAAAARLGGQREDVIAFPPPDQLHAATLGHDAAAVDALWADLLVQYGTHWSEHREFKDTMRYGDAILELEPDYAPLFRYGDTMLVYRPLQGTLDDARAARALLQRGVKARPNDGALWLEYGQFVSFIGPSFLHDPAEVQAWRTEGAEAIGHAVELGVAPDRALTAATLLTKAGQTLAALRYVERAYAFTEHPSMRQVHDALGERILALRAILAEQGTPEPAPAP